MNNVEDQVSSKDTVKEVYWQLYKCPEQKMSETMYKVYKYATADLYYMQYL